MNFKLILIIFITFFVSSCNINQLDEAKNIINRFYDENHIDKRETIFDIQARTESGIVILEGETDRPDLKNKIISSFSDIKIEDKINVLPDSTVGDNRFGLINISVANLRSEPKHSAELATQALMGTPVKILKIENGWLRVQTPDKYISWVDGEGVFTFSETDFVNWRNAKRIIFTGDNGAIYENTDFENPVSDVTTGNILEVVETDPKAIKIKFPDGRIGFSDPSGWIEFGDFKNTVSPDSIQLKNRAKQLMGRSYLWGGTSARAMDCSGFVKMLYFMNGIILARDASLQYKHGKIIQSENGFNNIQTGDLLFFGQKGSDNQPDKVTHVAFSLGKAEIIHASGKIKRNSLNPESKIYSEYRKKSFVGAKRVIGFENSEGIQFIKNHPWY